MTTPIPLAHMLQDIFPNSLALGQTLIRVGKIGYCDVGTRPVWMGTWDGSEADDAANEIRSPDCGSNKHARLVRPNWTGIRRKRCAADPRLSSCSWIVRRSLNRMLRPTISRWY